MKRTTLSLLYYQAKIRQRERRLLKGTQRDRTILTIRLGLDKIETKGHSIGRSSTYAIMLRLYRTKIVSIRGKTSAALRV